jgi:hypothetical protein
VGFGQAPGGIAEDEDPVDWTGKHSFAQTIIVPDGLVSDPSWNFDGAPTSGPYLISGSDWGLARGGAARLYIDGTGIGILDGLATGPSIHFNSETNTGVYFNSGIAMAVLGNQKFRIGVNDVTALVPILLPDGIISAPGVGFVSDPDSGLILPGTGTLGFVTGGAERFRLDSAELQMQGSTRIRTNSGSAGTPGLASRTSGTTGLFWVSTDVLGISAAGNEKLRADVNNIIAAVPVRIPNGTNPAPSIQFAGAANGFYIEGGRLQIKTSTVAASFGSGNIRAGAKGFAATPAISNDLDNNTGMYWGSSGYLYFASSGVDKMQINPGDIQSTVPLLVPDGAVGAPSISNTGDTDTGGYFPAADEYAIACGGAKKAKFTVTDQEIGVTKFTPIGGLAVLLTNKSGSTLNKGEIVVADTTTDDAVDLAPADSPNPIGAVYDTTIADDAAGWIVYNGIAQVLLETGDAAVRGDWLGTSDSTAGVVQSQAASPAVTALHFQEIGHSIQSAAGGTLCRAILHFN